MKQIKITDKNGITLHTKDKYCTEDIEVVIDQSILDEGGIDTSDATASANDILLDKTAYVNGEKITGTIETKSQENLVVEKSNVIVEAGYYPEQVSKSVAIVEQAELFLEINNNTGLIESSSNQEEGYVVGEKKVVTKQLNTKGTTNIIPSEETQVAVGENVFTTGEVTVAPIPSEYVKPTATKEATTYTPNTSNQTIASGTYLKGTQTIKGDTNLVADNIKKGTQIFGVEGTYDNSIEGVSANGNDFLNVTKEFQHIYVQGNQSIYCYSESQKNIYDANDEYLLSVNVDGDDNTSVNAPNLLASNIKKGVTILGIEGTLEAGDDVTEEVAEYTDLNTELEEVINSLPSAGGGGLQTLSASIYTPYDSMFYLNILYPYLENGVIKYGYDYKSPGNEFIVDTVKDANILIWFSYSGVIPNISPLDMDYYIITTGTYENELVLTAIPRKNNCVINIKPNTSGYE